MSLMGSWMMSEIIFINETSITYEEDFSWYMYGADEITGINDDGNGAADKLPVNTTSYEPCPPIEEW